MNELNERIETDFAFTIAKLIGMFEHPTLKQYIKSHGVPDIEVEMASRLLKEIVEKVFLHKEMK